MSAVLSSRRCAFFRQLFVSGLQSRSGSRATTLRSSEEATGAEDSRSTPVSRTNPGSFYLDAPELGNQFTQDAFARSYLKRVLPKQVLDSITPDLERFGKRIVDEINQLGYDAEQNQPSLKHYDAWGKRVDQIVTSVAWRKLHDLSAIEGLIATGYDRKQEQWSRLHQVLKLYLFAPSSGLYSCPLAMTDGAAKLIERSMYKDTPWLQNAYQRLTSREPALFWTSGQWMTEKRGGSDVANGTETIAREQSDGSYRLYGYKWFSSATDSDMSLTLARVQKRDGSLVQGTKGISLFYLETRDKDGNLNNIEVQKLKSKLGTRQLPTAELILDGTLAYKISDEGRGVAGISHMLTITRVHNTISAVAAMRRIINLARDYSTRRKAFSKMICKHPLHMQTLARMEVETRGAFCLLMEIGYLLGLDDCELSSESDSHLLRILTPVAKLYSAKQALKVISEGLECFGGQGYIEDTGLPTLFRDAQVLPIWEGTTNILSLDVLRSIVKSEGKVLMVFASAVEKKLSHASSLPSLNQSCSAVKSALDRTLHFASKATSQPPQMMELAARDFAYSLARIYVGALLIEHAAWTNADEVDIKVVQRWCWKDLELVSRNSRHGCYNDESIETDLALVMSGHPKYT